MQDCDLTLICGRTDSNVCCAVVTENQAYSTQVRVNFMHRVYTVENQSRESTQPTNQSNQ